jgi:hypothetical protein
VEKREWSNALLDNVLVMLFLLLLFIMLVNLMSKTIDLVLNLLEISQIVRGGVGLLMTPFWPSTRPVSYPIRQV